MADPRIKALRIKTGVVKRLAKEKVMYEREAGEQRQRIQKYKDEGKDEHDIRKQEEVLRECVMMIPDCQRRLMKAFDELKTLLETEAALSEAEEYIAAKKVLDEAEAQYPPPFMNKLTSEVESYPPVPMVNFNIPPPGFRPTSATETWHQHHPLPSILLPPQEHTVLQENASCQEVHAHQTSDLLWLKDWLQRRKTTGSHSQQKHPAVPLKLFDARCMLKLCLTKLEELDSLQVDLKINYHDLSPSCWKQKWDHIKKVQAEISTSLDKLHNPATLDALKMTLQKRKRKRLRERRQRALHKEALRESHIRRQNLHQKIDTWLKNMQEVVEKAKRDKSLKHEADQVLSDITRKKSEAQRQINMLAALQKLRRVRAQMATNRGERVDAEGGLRFVRVTEHLVKLWENQLKGYEVEEQDLRVMLDEAVVERTKSEISQDKQILAEWETLLFGKQEGCSSFYKAAEQDVDAFVAIRHSWDKFVASPGVVMSSSIPVGWVLPSNPSSEKWEYLLTNNKHLKM